MQMESLLCCGQIIGWNHWYPPESPLSQLHMGGSCRFLSPFVIASGKRPPSMIFYVFSSFGSLSNSSHSAASIQLIFFHQNPWKTSYLTMINTEENISGSVPYPDLDQNLMGSILGRDLHGNVFCCFWLILLTNQLTNKLNEPGIFSHCV